MKMYLMLVAAMTLMVGCSEDKLKVIHNNDRVSDLERRMKLNEDIDALQSQMLSEQAADIAALEAKDIQLQNNINIVDNRVTTLQQTLATEVSRLESLIEDEAEAREAGDQVNADALQDQIDAQTIINNSLQGQIDSLRNTLNQFVIAQTFYNIVMGAQVAQNTSKIGQLTNSLSLLTTRVSHAESDINSLEAEVVVIKQAATALKARVDQVELGLDSLRNRMTTVESNITGLRTDVDYLLANQVEIVDPCPNVTNSEILLKVQGKLVAFYQGAEGFLSVLTNGSYRTTDPQQCTFTVNNNVITASTPAVVTPPATTPTSNYKIEQYACSGNSSLTQNGNNCTLSNTYTVSNAGQSNYSLSPSNHGFVVNNNANNLGKANCNIDNLTSVTSTAIFENCRVTKLP